MSKFIKGQSGNPSGRPKGTKNKITLALRETINNFLEDNFHQITADFDKLSPKDRTKLYCDLLQYGLPKLQSTSTDIKFEHLSDEQLDEVINKLKSA